MDGAWLKEPQSAQIAEFLRMLAVCHTVLPEGGETKDTIKYQVAITSCPRKFIPGKLHFQSVGAPEAIRLHA